MELCPICSGDEALNDYDEYETFPPPLECILNVAGSRESHAPGIQEAVYQLMVDALIKVYSLESKHFLRLREGKRVGG